VRQGLSGPPPFKGVRHMAKKMEIVFFDDLGFGWLMEEKQIRRLRDREAIEEILFKHTLSELLRKEDPT
jgi:hypothetical protein